MVFAGMIDVLFEGPLGLDADYIAPAPGAETAGVRVIRRTESSEGFFGASGVMRPANGYDLRVSEIPTPEEGATLVVGAATYQIRSFVPDEQALVWHLDLEPA